MRTSVDEESLGDPSWAIPTLGWFGMQFVLTLLAYVVAFGSTLSIASCTATSCDYSAFSAAINTLYIGAIVLLVASGVGMFLLRARGRAMLAPPIVGSILLMVLLAGTYAAGRAALTLPLFGNRLAGCCS